MSNSQSGTVAVSVATTDNTESITSAPTASPTSPTTVLIVDMDGVSRRFIELALEREGNFQVESALDGAGALEILAHTQVHAIIADTELLDMSGLHLFRRLASESRLRAIPFLFLSSDRRVATRILAFEEGVDDFLVKPCDVGELVARLKAVVDRRRRTLAAMRQRGYMLAGRFSAMAFPDLVSLIEQSRHSGTLSVVEAGSAGAVHFDEGRVVHAHFGNLVGQPAFQGLMELADAQFEFTQEPCVLPEAQRSIRTSATALILETARLIDTRNHEDGAPAAVKPRERLRAGRESAKVRRTPVTRSMPLPITSGIASQLIHAIGDSFTLGDLELYTRVSLARWTASEGARTRFHTHLLADPSEAASAILALAGAPTERMVVGSLSPEAKALGLSFSLRHELLVDMVHLDIFNPRTFQASLTRTPSLVLVAPPDGDFLAIGTRARVELEQLVARTRPAAILGVGNPALEQSLRSLPALRDHDRLRTVEGVLGVGDCDLRTLLVEGIRLCTAGEAP